jgi:hypothetical protein
MEYANGAFRNLDELEVELESRTPKNHAPNILRCRMTNTHHGLWIRPDEREGRPELRLEQPRRLRAIQCPPL